jgi:hypothetical protein
MLENAIPRLRLMRQITFSKTFGNRLIPFSRISESFSRHSSTPSSSTFCRLFSERLLRTNTGIPGGKRFTLQLTQHFRSTHLRQDHVQQDQIGLLLSRQLQLFPAVFGADHFVPAWYRADLFSRLLSSDGFAVLHQENLHLLFLVAALSSATRRGSLRPQHLWGKQEGRLRIADGPLEA